MTTASCSSFVGTSSAFTNYARLGLATQNELPNILRELLFIKEPPNLLEAHLNNNSYLSRNLKAHEWKIIRTVRTNQYNEFDVPLIYKIIRNLNLVPSPTQGWDSQMPPLSTEITVGDDIERIRRVRNEIVHRGNTNVLDSELANYFSVFKELASRLEKSLMLSNRDFVSKIENVETCCIDNDAQQLYIRRLTELAENETQLASSVSEVKKDLACLGSKITGNISKLQEEIIRIKTKQMEVIPKNIRDKRKIRTDKSEIATKTDQILIDVEKWIREDRKFVPTKASKYIFRRLKNENCVTVVGSPGVGKTATTRHVALKMEGIGYTVIPVTVPTDIRDFYQPGQQAVFIIDDMCGNFTADKNLIDTWQQVLCVVDNILSNNCKIIVSCRSQVYNDNKFNVLAQFKTCECNLISSDFLLSKNERIQIAKAHLGKQGNDIPTAMLMQYDFFPLLCFLYSKQDNLDIIAFFDKPFTVFEKELNNLWNVGEVGQYKICGLVLCVIYNNKLDEKYLTNMEPSVRIIIEDVCEACGINRGTSRIKIKEEIDTLLGTYLKKENNVYITIHDKLFDFLVYFYGTQMLDCLIKHAMVGIINDRFHWKKLPEGKYKNKYEFILIPDDKLNLYVNRLILDWSHGKFVDLFVNNSNMKNEQFREVILNQLLHRDKAEQSQLSCVTETNFNLGISSLEACCVSGYNDLLPWFLNQDVDINQCTSITTPFIAACMENNIEMISKLLSFGVDINKPGLVGYTALHVSCFKDTDVNNTVFDLLLKNGACVNKRMYDGSTPLHLALYEHKRKTVDILLSQSADCNIGFYNSREISDGLKEAVKSLGHTTGDEEDMSLDWLSEKFPTFVFDHVNQKPNTVKQTFGGATPLHLMCFRNDIDMIRILLERHPDINKRKEDGATPLFVACQFGFIDIATILLEHGANTNICRNDGTSPLEMAKHKKHTEIISLMENPKQKLANKLCIDNRIEILYLRQTPVLSTKDSSVTLD